MSWPEALVTSMAILVGGGLAAMVIWFLFKM